MKSILLSSVFVSVFLLTSIASGVDDLPNKFDPNRNPERDLSLAIKIAKESGKNILLDIGGYWCPWCGIMETWLQQNTDVESHLHANFVLLKVNFSNENKNQEFLSQFPKIPGYPYFFVLSSEGTLLHSQRTGPLEEGKSYDKEKFMKFLKEWEPNKTNK
jgi:thioredoxin-related protein